MPYKPAPKPQKPKPKSKPFTGRAGNYAAPVDTAAMDPEMIETLRGKRPYKMGAPPPKKKAKG